MNTSEYSSRKERKVAKRITRHPMYQRVRERAIAAEAAVDAMRRDLKEAKDDRQAAIDSLEQLKAEFQPPDEPAAEADGG